MNDINYEELSKFLIQYRILDGYFKKLINSCESLAELNKLHSTLSKLNADDHNQIRDLPGDIPGLIVIKHFDLKEKQNKC